MNDPKKAVLRGLAALVFVFVAIGNVGAQQGGFYGISVGQSKASDACKGIDASIGFFGTCDDTGTGFKFFGGYNFTKNIGLEFGYVDLGKAEAVGTLFGNPGVGSVEASGFTGHAVGTLPINDRFSIFGKLGFMQWTVKLDVSATGGGSVLSAKETGVGVAGGIGATYHFPTNLGVSLRVEYELFPNLGDDATTGISDVHLISLGLMLTF